MYSLWIYHQRLFLYILFIYLLASFHLEGVVLHLSFVSVEAAWCLMSVYSLYSDTLFYSVFRGIWLIFSISILYLSRWKVSMAGYVAAAAAAYKCIQRSVRFDSTCTILPGGCWL